MHRQATYMLSGTLSFKCFDDPGPHYEAYGYLDIEVMGKTFEVWSVAESHPVETRISRSYVQRFSIDFVGPMDLPSSNQHVTLLGEVIEDDMPGDDIIGSYDGTKILVSTIFEQDRDYTFRGEDGSYVKITLRLDKKVRDEL